VTTGFTANRSVEAIGYYGGSVVGICSLYSAVREAAGMKVHSVYDVNDLPDYASYDFRSCPYCKQGRRIDALVNSFGYSAL
jgi:orotate phosphoribosyltransferase